MALFHRTHITLSFTLHTQEALHAHNLVSDIKLPLITTLRQLLLVIMPVKTTISSNFQSNGRPKRDAAIAANEAMTSGSKAARKRDGDLNENDANLISPLPKSSRKTASTPMDVDAVGKGRQVTIGGQLGKTGGAGGSHQKSAMKAMPADNDNEFVDALEEDNEEKDSEEDDGEDDNMEMDGEDEDSVEARTKAAAAKKAERAARKAEKAAKQAAKDAKKKAKKSKTKEARDPAMDRNHTEYCEFNVHCQPCPNTVNEVHTVCTKFFQLMKAADPAFCLHPVGPGAENMSIVSDPASLPTKHKQLKRYFYFTGDNKQWNNTIRDRPRKISGVLLMSSHDATKELIDDMYVDLFCSGFELAPKACQALITETGYLLLCVPHVLHADGIAKAVKKALETQQAKMIKTKKINASWSLVDFPTINIRMNYPKHAWDNNSNNNFVKKSYNKGGNDSNGARNAAKRCAHIEFAVGDGPRLHELIQAWKYDGGCKELFGPHAYVMETLEEDAGPGKLRRYKQFLQNHVSYGLSVAVISLNDIVDLDDEFKIDFTPDSKGNAKAPVRTTVRQELASIMIQKNVQLFQCVMQNKDGVFEAVIPNIPEAEQHAEQIARHLPAYMMFLWQRKRWTVKSVRMVMRRAFDRAAVSSAEENCKWDSRQQMVVTKYVDDEDCFLDSVRQASWIRKVPLNGEEVAVSAVPGQLRPTSMMAFNHEEGGSITTMKTVVEVESSVGSTSGVDEFETAADDETSVGSESHISISSGTSSSSDDSEDSMDAQIEAVRKQQSQQRARVRKDSPPANNARRKQATTTALKGAENQETLEDPNSTAGEQRNATSISDQSRVTPGQATSTAGDNSHEQTCADDRVDDTAAHE